MAMSANRFNFLDKATNIPTAELIKLADDAVYNIMPQLVDELALVTKDLTKNAADAGSKLAATLNLPVNKPEQCTPDGADTNASKAPVTEVLPGTEYTDKELERMAITEVNGWNGSENLDFLPVISNSGSLLNVDNILSSDLIKTYGAGIPSLDSITSSLSVGISNFTLPKLDFNVLDTISKFDLKGYKGFLSEIMDIGKFLLCSLSGSSGRNGGNGLDINIRNGLDRDFLSGLLDRFCNNYKSISNTSNKDVNNKVNETELFVPSKGIELNSENVFNVFKGYSYDKLMCDSTEVLPTAPYSDADFTSRIISGDISGAINNLRSSEISSTTKREKAQTIDDMLLNYEAGTPEFINLHAAKGRLATTIMISEERRNVASKYDGLNDKITSFGNDLINIKLDNPQFRGLTGVDSELYTKLQQYQTQVRSTNGNNTTLPIVTQTELNHIRELNITTDSHRDGNLHPTTRAMLEGQEYA